MKVLMTCGVFVPSQRGGGLVRAVARTVDTSGADIDLTLVTSDRDVGTATPYAGLSGQWVRRSAARVFYLNMASLRQWRALWPSMRAVTWDVVNVNSVFALLTTVFAHLLALRIVRARLVLVSPHGELLSGNLAIHATRKRLYLRVLPLLLGRLNTVWHATSALEAEHIAAVVPGARILICENQVALPHRAAPPGRASGSTARMVFIGRIAEEKNLLLTLEALSSVRHPVHFDIYGPLEDGPYWTRCLDVIAAMPRQVTVRYAGMLASGDVIGVFGAYDALVFPTLGENFGYVIAESLAGSCPVVCSPHTPWTPVLHDGGGVVIPDVTVPDVRAAIEAIAALRKEDRNALRSAAGSAYERWRRQASEANLFDVVRSMSTTRV